MCGILAYSGPRNVTEVLIDGLKKLEYRGYDSAGLAFFGKKNIQHFRVCGGVNDLEKKVRKLSYKNSSGIGHTRWATQGAPSEKNAHPHRSHSIYVVHNGVIENTEEIRQILGPNPLLLSDTDTELIPHLINHFCKKKSFLKSTLKCAGLLKGSYAVVAIHAKHPGEMIAFKSGPPLLFCKKKNEFFICSDSQAVGKGPLSALFLEDEELLFFKNNQAQIFNFKGEKLSRRFKKLSPKKKSNGKGPHPHFMIKEILEQPQAISRLINRHIDKKKKAIALKLSKGSENGWNSLLKNSSDLLILACGSSYYSALFAKYILEEIGGIKVHAEMASEFIYKKSITTPGAPALLISQSGETADILTALKQTKKKALKSFSLCNVANSTLERKACWALDMEAGPEIAVASTKSFSSSIMSLILLAFHIAKLKGWPVKERFFVRSLLAFPSDMEKALNCRSIFLKIMNKLKKGQSFFYLGRGSYYPIALEGALKLKEVAYLHAEGYPSGEMKHGPLALIDKNSIIVALLPYKGELYKKSLINLKEAKTRGARILSIGGPKKDRELKGLSDYILPLPESHKLLHPLLSLIPCQLMAYSISISNSLNPDRPRNLAKSVTVE